MFSARRVRNFDGMYGCELSGFPGFQAGSADWQASKSTVVKIFATWCGVDWARIESAPAERHELHMVVVAGVESNGPDGFNWIA